MATNVWPLVESISLRNGEVENLDWHRRRFNLARGELFSLPPLLPGDFLDLLDCEPVRTATGAGGHWKLRLPYGRDQGPVSAEPYRRPSFTRLVPVSADTLDYQYKWADRRSLEALRAGLEPGDCPVFVRQGLLTDALSANLALRSGAEWLTPRTPLLAGTCRERLVAAGILIPADLGPEDLGRASRICLINALNPLDTWGFGADCRLLAT